jgi:menaquinone-dependent protoporphyrinogen IX oxidase
MAKVLVMYFSKYGTTKKYAEWLSSELDGDICSIKNVNKDNLKNYDIIILGSGLYAGNIQGIDIIVNNYEQIRSKKLILFTCGLADYENMENVNSVNKRLDEIIPENIRQKIKIYYLRGGINYKKLSIKHKLMMWTLKMVAIKKENMNEENKEFIETYGQILDFTKKESLMGIIEYCKK